MVDPDPIDEIVDDVVSKLKSIMDAANRFYKKEPTRRNEQAVQAASNNWNSARELKLQPNSTIPNKFMEKYEHTKKWEKQFNDWGGHNNTYAAYCHGQAKEIYFEALQKLKDLGETISTVTTNMVSKFQSIDPRPGSSSYEHVVEIKSGYARTTTLEKELHTKIVAEAKASANFFASSVEASLGTEVASAIKGSSSIINSQERSEKVTITLNLEEPVYVYQTSFAAVMADGTTLNAWGTGYIISSKPIA